MPLGRVEIAFRPFRSAQLARSHKHKRCELERKLAHGLAPVAINRAEELTDAAGLSDRGMISCHHRCERSAQVRCRIALRAACGNREAQNGPALGARTVGGFVDPACFDALQDGEESGRQNARDGSLTDVRENEVFKEDAFLRESDGG